jgi:hypothetical protein
MHLVFTVAFNPAWWLKNEKHGSVDPSSNSAPNFPAEWELHEKVTNRLIALT